MRLERARRESEEEIMKIIDADAHVIENESAWDYMLESERQFDRELSARRAATRRSIIGTSTAD